MSATETPGELEQRIERATNPVMVVHKNLLRKLLMGNAAEAMLDSIEATGGVELVDGHYQPLADREWIDLGEAYISACKTLGREPVIYNPTEK